MGGPGYMMQDPSLMNPAAAENLEGYGTLNMPDSGNVAPEVCVVLVGLGNDILYFRFFFNGSTFFIPVCLGSIKANY